jgi:lipid II:glycine glycyltransferase (peptidoglycan interpeptide bridge formation enzyme)
LVQYLTEQGKCEKIDFIRICPFIANNQENQQLFTALGFKISPLQTIAENLWILNLEPSEEVIWQGLRKTMRNLIRRAERENVIIRPENNVENFIKLHKYTVAKHHFAPYPDQLFREQFGAFKDDQQAMVWTAFHENQPLASAIVMYYGNTASYHHGASITSKIPAPYLLQWQAIKEAKNRGCKYYNFWGIYPDNNPKLAGVSQFKRGFGGYQKDLLPGQDLPLSWKYNLNCLVEKYRRRKRGYVKR